MLPGDYFQTGRKQGMQSMDDTLIELFGRVLITADENVGSRGPERNRAAKFGMALMTYLDQFLRDDRCRRSVRSAHGQGQPPKIVERDMAPMRQEPVLRDEAILM